MPQQKTGKSAKAPQHEFCQGYTDKNGIWNNGFFCRKWGKEDDKYCCGEGTAPYCCPEPTRTPPPAPSTTTLSMLGTSEQRQQQFMRHLVGPTTIITGSGYDNGLHPHITKINTGPDLFPVLVGAGVGGLLMLLCLLLVCLFCPCCPCYLRKNRRRSNKPIVGNQTLPFNVEAEATSAVIAAQALQHIKEEQQKQQQQQHLLSNNTTNIMQQHHQMLSNNGCNKQHLCNNGEEGHLHCGCRWSPSTSRSTVVDLDSLIATMQQNINNTWQQQQQQEMDLSIPYSCDPYRSSSTNNNNFNNISNNFSNNNNSLNNNNKLTAFSSYSHSPDMSSSPFNHLLSQTNNAHLYNTNSADRSLNMSPPIIMDTIRPSPFSSSSSSTTTVACRSTTTTATSNNNTYYPIEDNNSLKSKHSNSSSGNNTEQSSLLNGRNILQQRGYTYSPHQLNDLRQLKTLLEECPDKPRRDSGVLVEEPDVIQDTNTSSYNNHNNNNNNNNKHSDPSYMTIDDKRGLENSFSNFMPNPRFPSPPPQLLTLTPN